MNQSETKVHARKLRKDGTPELRMGEKRKLKAAKRRAEKNAKFAGMMRFLKTKAAINNSKLKKAKA